MENSLLRVSLFSEPQNPWGGSDKSLNGLRNALVLGEQTGHIAKRTDYDSHEVSDDVEDTLPSLKLIKILKEMSRARKELDRVNLEIQCRLQDKETSDLTHLDQLEGRIAKIKSLNSHIESIIDSKTSLIQRLQQPFQGDFIKLEAQYHRFASELFPQIAPLLADLTTNLENIVWAKSLNSSDQRMDLLITELCSALGAMQTSFQSYCQIQQSMGQLHNVQTGVLHSTALENL